MATTVDELTVNFEEDGRIVSKEIDKVILTKGAWSTIIFRYQDLDRKTEEFGPDKFSIRRYQKRNGEYQYKSKFNISSRDQATKVVNALNSWLDDEPKENNPEEKPAEKTAKKKTTKKKVAKKKAAKKKGAE